MSTEITNDEDWINASDLRERIAEIESRAADLDELEAEELAGLQQLAGAISGYSRSALLIRDSYFTTYAQDMAEENGMIAPGGAWPGPHVDWEAAASALRTDYQPVDFGGVTYLVRG